MEMKMMDIMSKCRDLGASDIFVTVKNHVMIRIDGNVRPIDDRIMDEDGATELIKEMYYMANRHFESNIMDDDFSFGNPELGRFRVNICKQRNTLTASIRLISLEIPNYSDMRIPDSVMKMSEIKSGLVLFVGNAGAGKSTTQACVIDCINRTRMAHVITLEDPIEFIHLTNRSLVTQRELGVDVMSWKDGLKSALRSSPDVILLGEMRDRDTVSMAVSAAESGHCVFGTMHTSSAADTLNRLVGMFDGVEILSRLSQCLSAVVAQKLVTDTNGRMVPAFEIMKANGAIKNLIREGKMHQIDIQSFHGEGMVSMNGYLKEMVKNGIITEETMRLYKN